MSNKEHYNSYYQNASQNYNAIRLDAHNDMENVINLIKEYVPKESTILDIGCGTGKYGELLKMNGYNVKGIDSSIEQINQAKLVIDATLGDATNLPYKDSYFTATTMIIMIQQLTKEERIKAFSEAYRVLKPHGLLIIKTCSHSDLENRFTAKFFPKTLEIDKKRYPDIPELKEELSMFSSLEIINSSIKVKKSKERYLNRFQKRGTSNLSFLTDEELQEGIHLFEKRFANVDEIEKVTKNTFIIVRKD